MHVFCMTCDNLIQLKHKSDSICAKGFCCKWFYVYFDEFKKCFAFSLDEEGNIQESDYTIITYFEGPEYLYLH